MGGIVDAVTKVASAATGGGLLGNILTTVASQALKPSAPEPQAAPQMPTPPPVAETQSTKEASAAAAADMRAALRRKNTLGIAQNFGQATTASKTLTGI